MFILTIRIVRWAMRSTSGTSIQSSRINAMSGTGIFLGKTHANLRVEDKGEIDSSENSCRRTLYVPHHARDCKLCPFNPDVLYSDECLLATRQGRVTVLAANNLVVKLGRADLGGKPIFSVKYSPTIWFSPYSLRSPYLCF